jgi:hypothetical protein
MAETPAALVTDVLGWKLTEDKAHVLLGFRQPDGNDFVLALAHETLMKAITSLVSALSAFAGPRLADGEKLVLKTDWYEVGESADGNFLVSFRVENGGSLGFLLTRVMAERLLQTLGTALGVDATPIPPGTVRQ